jgi:hypothetical protein
VQNFEQEEEEDEVEEFSDDANGENCLIIRGP